MKNIKYWYVQGTATDELKEAYVNARDGALLRLLRKYGLANREFAYGDTAIVFNAELQNEKYEYKGNGITKHTGELTGRMVVSINIDFLKIENAHIEKLKSATYMSDEEVSQRYAAQQVKDFDAIAAINEVKQKLSNIMKIEKEFSHYVTYFDSARNTERDARIAITSTLA